MSNILRTLETRLENIVTGHLASSLLLPSIDFIILSTSSPPDDDSDNVVDANADLFLLFALLFIIFFVLKSCRDCGRSNGEDGEDIKMGARVRPAKVHPKPPEA